MSQDWYYSVEGSQQGPVTAAELKKLATDGKLKPDDLVWKDGMAEWKPASTIKGLFGAGGSSPGVAAAKVDEPVAKADPERDDRPSRRGRDEDDEDRPRRRSRDEDDEDEDRPRNRRRVEDDDEDEDRPRRRGRDEDDEDDDRPRKKKKGGRVPDDVSSKKMTAGLLAILIGGLGIHKFYLGMPTAGIIQIVLSFCTFGLCSVIPLIEGIIYLTKSDEDFYREYIVNQKQWF